MRNKIYRLYSSSLSRAGMVPCGKKAAYVPFVVTDKENAKKQIPTRPFTTDNYSPDQFTFTGEIESNASKGGGIYTTSRNVRISETSMWFNYDVIYRAYRTYIDTDVYADTDVYPFGEKIESTIQHYIYNTKK